MYIDTHRRMGKQRNRSTNPSISPKAEQVVKMGGENIYQVQKSIKSSRK